MECLRDYIGVRGGCGNTVPPSSLYVNDLPGISFRQISSLADSQQQTFAGVWEDIQTRAMMRIADDVRADMAKRYKLNRLLDSINIPRGNLDPLTGSTLAAQNPLNSLPYGWAGVSLDIDYGINSGDENEFITSPLMGIHVQSVWVYIDSNSYGGYTIPFKIIDLQSGEELFGVNIAVPIVSLTNGWNNVEVNKTFNSDVTKRARKIFIGIYVNKVGEEIQPNIMDCESVRNEAECCKFYLQGAQLTGNEANGYISDPVPLVYGSDSFGVAPITSLICDYAALICTNKELFKRPYLYALGVETMLEQAYSDRLNEYSLTRRAQALENLERFTADYQKSLQQITDTIDLGCDCCVECGGKVNPYIIEQTP